MNYVASLSCGKDSLAMVLRLIEEGKPLTHCVMFDTGVEFRAIYNELDKLKPVLASHSVHLEVITPQNHFLEDMLLRTVNKGKETEHYGYEWCGGACRWRTTNKVSAINKYLSTLGDYIQYVGIASDEPERIKEENNKVYPLVEWGMAEADCLQYCYERGYTWEENGYKLYDLLDRVSCWCCTNKNLKELKNIYLYLPEYWDKLKALQSRINRPYKGKGKSVFDLENRFSMEGNQLKF